MAVRRRPNTTTCWPGSTDDRMQKTEDNKQTSDDREQNTADRE
jgi:hypothetical protein